MISVITIPAPEKQSPRRKDFVPFLNIQKDETERNNKSMPNIVKNQLDIFLLLDLCSSINLLKGKITSFILYDTVPVTLL
jgi:hypothetical protein